jgi:Ig-like domain from next to BRCA1 gene
MRHISAFILKQLLSEIIGNYGTSTWAILLWQIPANGLAANESVNISMDLKTPSSPGKYSALWKLVSSYGLPIECEQQISVSITVSAWIF